MKLQNGGVWRYVVSALGAIAVIFTIVTIVVGGQIDAHEAEFETKQRETVIEIKEDIAALKANQAANQRQLDNIQEQGKHTQELVEQLIREN